MNCFAGIPTEGKQAFMTTSVKVVDVARFDHFDLGATAYPEKSKYFLYGNNRKAYISHIPTMKPDFLQVSNKSPYFNDKDEQFPRSLFCMLTTFYSPFFNFSWWS